MKILYIAPYVSDEYKSLFNQKDIGSLAATIKIELIANILCEMGHEVLILSSVNFHANKYKFRKSFLEYKNINSGEIKVYYPFGLRCRGIGGILNIFFSPLIELRLRKLINPDIIISYNANLFEYSISSMVRSRSDVPLLLEIEDLPLSRRRGLINLKPLLDKWSWKKMLNLADGFTAVNPGILFLLPQEKPNMLLPGILNPLLERTSDCRIAPFKLKQKTLGYFGGLTTGKGVEVLIELACQLPEDWNICICGMGNLSKIFEDIAIINKNVKFHGVVPAEDMYRLMASCDALLVPTESSANSIGGVFPFKILEYCISRAHVISPVIQYLDYFNLSFISRWDGTVEDLKLALIEAERNYFAEELERNHIIKELRERYNIGNIKTKFNNLFDLIKYK